MIFKCLFTISAVCLQFSNVNNQLFVYFFEFSSKNIDFCKVFCQNVEFKSLIFYSLFTFLFIFSAVCWQLQLFVYFLCQLFIYFFAFSSKTLIFVKSFAKMSSLNSWFSAVCLHFCLHCQLKKIVNKQLKM